MSAHTPGPWTVEVCRLAPRAPAFGFAVRAAGKVPFVASAGVVTPNHVLVVDEAFPIDTGYTAAEVEANGYLMAAAPDLLSALKRCAAVVAGETMHKGGLIAALEAARAAIAKATGSEVPG